MRNKITDVGVAAIAKAVAKHPRIEVLNLVRNEVGDAGALALGEALKENESLKELLLNYNKIGTAGIKAIGDALDGGNASLVRLMVAENEVEDKEVLRNTLRLARDLRDKSNYVAE
jgi:Ran GTPase-activating protein (RanGAP) involved in mRNA processing and transport